MTRRASREITILNAIATGGLAVIGRCRVQCPDREQDTYIRCSIHKACSDAGAWQSYDGGADWRPRHSGSRQGSLSVHKL